mmetsp:Transcript_14318/g.40502  ORF Transcript_14318/g.40502 Transcript_14318/m.40502 type:complete len:232 (-) Transcript_14318:224-919(-)
MELLYLPLRARGEALHMIAAYSRLPLKKVDVPFSEWGGLKETMPVNKAGKQQLPVLKKEDGSLMAESHDIAKYLAKKAGPPMMPSDTSIADRAAEMWDFCDAGDKDFCCEAFPKLAQLNPMLNLFPAEKGQKMLAAARPHFPGALASLEAQLGGGFYGGDLPFYSDFAIWHLLDNMCTLDGGEALRTHGGQLAKFYEAVPKLPGVKEYLENRPKARTGALGNEGSIIATKA